MTFVIAMTTLMKYQIVMTIAMAYNYDNSHSNVMKYQFIMTVAVTSIIAMTITMTFVMAVMITAMAVVMTNVMMNCHDNRYDNRHDNVIPCNTYAPMTVFGSRLCHSMHVGRWA